jgi:transposase InsO family protein
MDVKLAAAIGGAVRTGEVAAFCREHGISRQTFYKWKHRFETEGLAGLEERSRRPQRIPIRVSLAVEDDIVRMRKHLADFGVDAGAWSIRQHLARESPEVVVPSEATIWRILTRRGLIIPEPKKRPKVTYRRFCWERPNDLWQIDATHWTLADGAPVEIINIIDDHSRVCAISLAVTTCTTERAWEAFTLAATTWALPTRVLSDNGLPFNASRRNKTVAFEANLRDAGVVPIASTPHHPQTCGKVERFHQTLKKWLDHQPRAATLAELQSQLDTFIAYYNHKRPHRALKGATPATTWHATPRAVPANHPITDTSTVARNLLVSRAGTVLTPGHSLGIGIAYSGQTVTVIRTGNDCAIFHNNKLLRALTIDPNRFYQRSGRPRSGRPRSGRPRKLQQ